MVMVHGTEVRIGKSGCGLATEMVVGRLWPKSSICLLVNSLTHSFSHSFSPLCLVNGLFSHSRPVHLCIHSSTHLYSCFCALFIHSIIQLLSCSFFYGLATLSTHSFIYLSSFFYALVYSLSHLFICLCIS